MINVLVTRNKIHVSGHANTAPKGSDNICSAVSALTLTLEETGASISGVQAAKLKEFGKSGELTLAMVRLILSEEKPRERKVTLKSDKINRFFPEDYSSDDIEGIIIQPLEEWQSKQ